MSLFPLDETDLPERPTMVTYDEVRLHFGVGPWRIVLGAGLGAIAGYVLHNESTAAWKRLKQRDEYRARLGYQYRRDHPQ